MVFLQWFFGVMVVSGVFAFLVGALIAAGQRRQPTYDDLCASARRARRTQ